MPVPEKWYHNLTPKEGALEGWHHEQSENRRHRALIHAVHVHGYQPTIASLNRLRAWTKANSKRPDPIVHRQATKDEAWLERWHAQREIGRE